VLGASFVKKMWKKGVGLCRYFTSDTAEVAIICLS
jgi:hypothetical protein